LTSFHAKELSEEREKEKEKEKEKEHA